MKQDILKLAQKKLDTLSKKYNNFIYIFVDDWRGFRFVYDTTDVRICHNDCVNCPLYTLLKNEKENIFSASLYPANKKDKQLFGSQTFLNCKTIEQYKQCFVNFLVQKARTPQEIEEELQIIQQVRLVYAKNGDIKTQEKNF
jgi:hypothetical protein